MAQIPYAYEQTWWQKIYVSYVYQTQHDCFWISLQKVHTLMVIFSWYCFNICTIIFIMNQGFFPFDLDLRRELKFGHLQIVFIPRDKLFGFFFKYHFTLYTAMLIPF